MKIYDTVIFDMDGTLLDTLQDLTDSVNHVLREYGYQIKTLKEIREFVGNGISRLMALSVPGGEDNPHFTECLQKFRNYYEINMENKTEPYLGVLELLEQLYKDNYKMAVVSNKINKAVNELTRSNFGKYIKISVGEMENVARKPSSDSVNMALSQIGSKKEKAIYVGDSEVDMQTARNAGIISVAVTWGFRDKKILESQNPDFVINDPAQLLDVLEKLNNNIKYN